MSMSDQHENETESLEQQLRSIAKQGDVEKLKDIIFLHSDDASHLIQSLRILHTACTLGHLGIVDYILSNNLADIEATNAMDETPLMITCGSSFFTTSRRRENNSSDNDDDIEETNFRIVKLLVEKGHAKIGYETKQGRVNMLHAACSSGSKRIVQYLVEEYQNSLKKNLSQDEVTSRMTKLINAKTAVGKFPLAIAAENDFIDIVEYLVSDTKLADVNLQSGQDQFLRGGTALHFGSSSLPIVRFLVGTAKADVNAVNAEDRSTPLHYCCFDRRFDCVQYLILAGRANANVINSLGESPLYKAVDAGDDRIAQFLLEKGGAMVDFATEHLRMTALHKASWNNNSGCVRELVMYRDQVSNKNVDVLNLVNCDGNTPLHMACLNGAGDVVDFLIQGHINPVARNSKNHQESRKKDFEVDTTIRNSEGKTAKEVAEEKQNHQIVEYFEQNVPEGGCQCVIC